MTYYVIIRFNNVVGLDDEKTIRTSKYLHTSRTRDLTSLLKINTLNEL